MVRVRKTNDFGRLYDDNLLFDMHIDHMVEKSTIATWNFVSYEISPCLEFIVLNLWISIEDDAAEIVTFSRLQNQTFFIWL